MAVITRSGRDDEVNTSKQKEVVSDEVDVQDDDIPTVDDQMLDRLVGRAFYFFLDGYSGYNQILITLEDQEKTTFICLYGTFVFSRMLFGLCNAPATFQWCMVAIFIDMVDDFLEVFMDGFSVVGNSFEECLGNLGKVLA
uniref:RNA-directed DNA polymerase homolog n=1 Tax=Nicotiana tabacum TaxID=4097 RepID=A0A1S4BGV0_TOBAC|nr:PREDICTED: RNA-directed DNA polymerase homolog [Nicotiana tabacum]